MQNYYFKIKLMPDDTHQMSRAMENICCSKMLLNSFVSRLKANYFLNIWFGLEFRKGITNVSYHLVKLGDVW